MTQLEIDQTKTDLQQLNTGKVINILQKIMLLLVFVIIEKIIIMFMFFFNFKKKQMT